MRRKILKSYERSGLGVDSRHHDGIGAILTAVELYQSYFQSDGKDLIVHANLRSDDWSDGSDEKFALKE